MANNRGNKVLPAQEEPPNTQQNSQPSGATRFSKKRKRLDDSFGADQTFSSSGATRLSKKCDRAEDTFGADLYEEIDRQFRVLENRTKWASFISHAWQPTYLAMISEVFGDMPENSSEFIEAKNRIMTRIKNFKHAVLYHCEVCTEINNPWECLLIRMLSYISASSTKQFPLSSLCEEKIHFIVNFLVPTISRTSCSYGII